MLFAVTLIVATGAAATQGKAGEQGKPDNKKDDDFNRTFNAPVETVFTLAVQTAANNWHLQTSNKNAYTLAFNTATVRTSVGFDMSVACVDLGGRKTRVTVHPQRRASRELFSWKEGNLISDTFLDKLAVAVRRAPAALRQRASTPAAASRAQPDDRARVQIKSAPAGADILVDGLFVGNTPSELRLTAGEHSIKVQKPGFHDWERNMTVIAGGSITLNATLQRQ